MNKKYPIFFGHWRHLLKLAREQSNSNTIRELDQLACHSASIILSRTCMEIFFNELYFMQTHESVLSSEGTHYSKRKKKKITLNYNNFVSLHICERLEVLYPNVKGDLLDELSLQNQIRNYCIHYTASNIKHKLEVDFEKFWTFGSETFQDERSPQQRYVNRATSTWCNDVTLRAIIAVERAQKKPHSNTNLNIEHCLEMLKEG